MAMMVAAPCINTQGVSRSQATLCVCASSHRVLVTHRSAAVNGIRVFRWTGSPGLVTDEKKPKTASPASAAAKLAKAGKIVDGGQRVYLYPGDLIQLDGFRNPELSTCSYVLHPLPPGWCKPTRGGGRPSSASAPAAATATATVAIAATAPARGGGGGTGGSSGTRPPTGLKTLAADPGDKEAEASSPIIARRRASSPAGAQGASAPRGRAIYGPTGTATRRECPAPVPEPRASQRGEPAAASAEASEVAAAAAAAAGSLRTISAGAAASDGKFPSPAPVGKIRGLRISPSPTSAAAAASAAAAGVGCGAKRRGTPGVAARGGPSSESGASRTGAGRAVSSTPRDDGDNVKKKLRMSPGGPVDAAAAAAGDGHDHNRDGVFPPSSSFSPSPASEGLRLPSETSRATPSPGGSSIRNTATASKKRPSPSAEKEEEQEKKGEGDGRGGACPGSSSKASRRGGASTPDRSRGGSSVSGSENVRAGEVVTSVGCPFGETAPTAGEVAAVAVATAESIDGQVRFLLHVFFCCCRRCCYHRLLLLLFLLLLVRLLILLLLLFWLVLRTLAWLSWLWRFFLLSWLLFAVFVLFPLLKNFRRGRCLQCCCRQCCCRHCCCCCCH